MSLRWFCLGLLPYTALTRAASIPDSHVLHEARQSLPQGWEKGNRISQDTTHQVRFGLRQQNLDKGHDCLTNISDPDSPHYGQWWSQDQIRDFFSPSIETSDRIRDWISDSLPHVQGLTQSHNRAWLEVELTNAELESLVHAEFHEYRHISGRSEPAAEEYHVPLRVRDHLDFITPGVALSLGRREEKVHQRSVPEGYSGEAAPLSKRDQEPAEKCNPSAISYTCLNKLYGLPGHPKTAQKGNLHASFLAGGATYNASAVNLFLKTYTDVPENTFPSEWLIDGASPVKGGVDSVGEAHIAIVLAQPIVYPIPSVFLVQDDSVYAHTYATGNGNQMLEAIDSSYCTYSAHGIDGDRAPWDQIYPNPDKSGYQGQKQCGVFGRPTVISSAWDTSEDYFPITWQKRQCDEYMKLALSGTTYVVATGDFGIGSTCYGPDHDQWNVPWPANCPYVLGVGGTSVKPDANFDDPDAVNEISLQASSGGISAIYPRPDWQKDAVAHYLATAKINTPGYTGISREIEFPLGLNDTVVELVGGAADRPRRALSGRGVPDVAAVGSIALNCDTSGGKVYQCGGTSSSAEIVGAIITRINDLRLAAGKPVVGYIHPTIYKHPEMFHDISEGPNNAGNGECKEPGYPPAVGWDPITGLGTFNFAKAAKVFLSV